jgi:hypothetical protein
VGKSRRVLALVDQGKGPMATRGIHSTYDFRGARLFVFGNGESRVDLKPLEKLVLLALIEHAPNIRPGMQRLANLTGLSERGVIVPAGLDLGTSWPSTSAWPKPLNPVQG